MYSSGQLTCSFCAYSTNKRFNLQRHTRRVHGHELLNGEPQGANVEREDANVNIEDANVNMLVENVNIEDENVNSTEEGSNNRVKCPDCYKTFASKKTLSNHIPICKKIQNPYSCPICLLAFSARQSKSRHMKTCKSNAAASHSGFAGAPQLQNITNNNTTNNNTTNNNTTNNNTTNNNLLNINNTYNIHINNFGEEDLSYITPQLMYNWLLQKNGIGLFNFFKHVHLNMEAPQNHNIRDHPMKKMVEVKQEGEWVVADCEDTLDKALRKCRGELLAHSSDPEFREKLDAADSTTELYNLLQNHMNFGVDTTPNYFYKIMRMFCAEIVNFARKQNNNTLCL